MIDCVDCAWSIPNWCYFQISIPHSVCAMLSKYVANTHKLRFYCNAHKNLFSLSLFCSDSMPVVLCQIPFFILCTRPLYLFFLSITIYVIFQMILHSLFVSFVFFVVVVIVTVINITGVDVVSETIILCIFFVLKVVWIVKECR